MQGHHLLVGSTKTGGNCFLTGAKGEMRNPVHCSVPTILEFLQSLLDDGRCPATVRVYVAAISAQHTRADNRTVGSHRLVSLFLKGSSEALPPEYPKGPYMGPALGAGCPMLASC